MHRRVMERSVVEERDMPEVEVGRPHRQRDERVREHTQALDELELQHRTQDRPRQPDHEAQRREVAQDDVLEHVHEEEMLLAEVVDRRVEREDDEPDSRPEARLPRP